MKPHFQNSVPRKTCQFRLTQELLDAMEALCREHLMTKSSMCRTALVQYMGTLMNQPVTEQGPVRTFPIPTHYNRP